MTTEAVKKSRRKKVRSRAEKNHPLPSKPLIGLALSGGGPRGFAHVGVLKAFEENQIRPDMISGTSIGALIGSAYAFGASIEAIHKKALEMSWSSVSSFSLSKFGLLSNRVIGEIVRELAGEVSIEDSPIPLSIVTTDIGNGKKVVFREGDLAQIVMASSCIPGIFIPVQVENRLLVDGFLVENVPISPLVEMGAEIKIAVNLGEPKTYREPNGIVNIMLNAFEIAIDANTRSWLRDADIVIKPELVEIPESDDAEKEAFFIAGYLGALKAIPLIRQRIQQWNQPEDLPVWKRIVRRVFSTSARSAKR